MSYRGVYHMTTTLYHSFFTATPQFLLHVFSSSFLSTALILSLENQLPSLTADFIGIPVYQRLIMATLGAFVSIDQRSPITDPAPVLQKGVTAFSTAPTIHELDKLNFGSRYSGPSSPPSPHRAQSSTAPNGLEMSRPPSPMNEDMADVVQTLSHPPINKYRLLSACLMCFGNGINGMDSGYYAVKGTQPLNFSDSAPGALLPYIGTHEKSSI